MTAQRRPPSRSAWAVVDLETRRPIAFMEGSAKAHRDITRWRYEAGADGKLPERTVIVDVAALVLPRSGDRP